MQRNLLRHGRSEGAASLRNGTDRIDKFTPQTAFQEIASRPGSERPQGLSIAGIGRQHENSRIWRMRPDLSDRLNAPHARHLDIHQRNVGPQRPEARDPLFGRRDFTNQLHVWLDGYYSRDPCPEHRMIIHDQQSDLSGMRSHRHANSQLPRACLLAIALRSAIIAGAWQLLNPGLLGSQSPKWVMKIPQPLPSQLRMGFLRRKRKIEPRAG